LEGTLLLGAAGVTELGERTYDIDGNATYSYSLTPSAAQCDTAAANLTAHLNSYNSTVLSLLTSQRLGDLRTTGKFGQRLVVENSMRGFLNSRYDKRLFAASIHGVWWQCMCGLTLPQQ
jgi:hypothetical protein